jgi:hypothetical protein
VIEWKPVSGKGPVKIKRRGQVNSVLVWQKDANITSHYQVVNVAWFEGHSYLYSHWASLTPPTGKRGL